MNSTIYNKNIEYIDYIYYVNENLFLNTYNNYIVNILAVMSILTAIFVITTKNPIVSILHLILLFSLVSIYLIYVGISFIGISYLLVYVGAVSILFLFILMLINIRISELSSDNNNSILLVLVAALSLTFTINSTLVVNTFDLKGKGYFANISDIVNEYNLNTILNEGWDNKLMAISHIKGIGNIMYTTYSLWLIIISVILLLAMVGAIIITINNKQEKFDITKNISLSLYIK